MPRTGDRLPPSGRRRAVGAAAAFAASLAACGPLPTDAPLITGAAPSADATSVPAAWQPGVREATLAAPRPPLTAAMLPGLRAADVHGLLGAPGFRRREGPAEIWQYFGPGCVLDLFLYGDDGSRRVVYHHLRGQVAGRVPDKACLDDLLGGRRGQRLG